MNKSMLKINKKQLLTVISIIIFVFSFSGYSDKIKYEKNNYTEIISRGTAVKSKNKIYIYIELTENKIEKGDYLTILPMKKEV